MQLDEDREDVLEGSSVKRDNNGILIETHGNFGG
jgi:hypothetical protein